MTNLSRKVHRLKPKRIGLSKKLRFSVFSRDGFRCRYCGADAEESTLHADHRHPVSRGGETTLENLVTACADCNLGKSDSELCDVIEGEHEMAVGACAYRFAIEYLHCPRTYEVFDLLMNAAFTLTEKHLMSILSGADSWACAEPRVKLHCFWAKSLFSKLNDDVGDVI